ncbi:helix-turn-helix domain-containing protein [Bradyrhizobium sp. B097]|uniref:winged helix-turn-helix transcriptional regulator n=1 Tax=Bradyrhizobium sp. B097 TaxID=3140244 RepID=UPI003182EE06
MSGTTYRQFCALARAAEIVGERWTLLIIRELLIGPKRFSDLLNHLNGMSPTLLTSRLAALIESGVIRKIDWQGPVTAQLYELTESGREIQPAIRELIRWGGRYLFPPRADDEFEPDWVLLGLDAIARRTPVPAIKVGLVVTHGKKSAGFTVAGGDRGTTITRGEAGCKATLQAPFDALLQIVGKRISLDKAIADKRAKLRGPAAPVRQLPLLFDLADRLS